MAHKKTTHKRRKKSLPALSSPRRRKKTKRGFMGDLLNPTIAKDSFMSTLSGGIGGSSAIAIHKMLPATNSKLMRIGIALGAGFLASSFGFKNVGSGFTGGLIALSFQNGLLADDLEETPQNNAYADPYALADKPLYLDADGEPFVIEEDHESGEAYTRYLSEEEKEMLQDED